MLSFVCFFIFVVQIFAQEPCLNHAFFGASNLTDCIVTARQNLPCGNYSSYGVTYITMSCDNSTAYNLPVGIDGSDTFSIQNIIYDMMDNLSTSYGVPIYVNCQTNLYTQYEFFCKFSLRRYHILTCSITSPQGEPLPPFPDYLICSGNKYSAPLLSLAVIALLFLLS